MNTHLSDRIKKRCPWVSRKKMLLAIKRNQARLIAKLTRSRFVYEYNEGGMTTYALYSTTAKKIITVLSAGMLVTINDVQVVLSPGMEPRLWLKNDRF